MTTLDQNNRQLASDYIAQGWQLCVIPKGTKGPTTVGWNDPSNAVRTVEQLPEGFDGNIGLLHSLSGTCAIDVDDTNAAITWLDQRGVSLTSLMLASDAVQIRSGRENSGKLIYSLPFPMPSKKVIEDGKTILEFRCASAEGKPVQDLLPPSVHPSGSTYAWAGGGSFTALPMLPTDLMIVWVDLMTPAAPDAAKPTTTVEHDTTPFARVESAVLAIPADCDRKTHTEVGMALHLYGQQSDQSEQAKELFLRWSRTGGEKFISDADVLSQWHSYRNDKATVVTVASVYHHAIEAGWVRPVPDVSGMFGEVKPSSKPTEWTPPVVDDSMFNSGLPHPKLDTSVLPSVLLAAATVVSENVGCDPMVPVAAGLIAACTVADSRSTLQVKEGMIVRPILRAMPIGNASDSKTPGSRPMFEIVETLQTADKDRYDTAMLVWSGQEAKHASDMKAYKEWSESPESGFPGAVPPTVIDLPLKPSRLRLKTNGSTTAKVLSMLADRPYGMTYILDDGSEWLESLVTPNKYESKTVYLRTYEGGPDNIDRVGSGEIHLPNAALSMYLNVHPDIMHKHREKLSSDGSLQRMIPIPLDSTKTTAGGSPPGYSMVMKVWDDAMRNVHAVGETSYRFTPEASVAWQAFKDETTAMKKDMQVARYSNYVIGYTGKLDGLAARVALVFHMIEDPHRPEVGVETLRRAIVFARYALRCAAFVDSAHMEAESVEAWIIRHLIVVSGRQETITQSEIIRSGRRAFEKLSKWQTDEIVRGTMEFLCSRGWVALHTDHPRFMTWAFNPNMKTLFAERRDGLAKVRAALLAKMRGETPEG